MHMERESIAKLAGCALFANLDENAIIQAERALRGSVRSYAAGENYCHPGDVLTDIGVILEGSMLAVRISGNGEESLIHKYKTGYMVGGETVCTDSRKSPYEIYSPRGAAVYVFDFERLNRRGCMDEELRDIMLRNLRRFLANETLRNGYKVDILSESGLRERIWTFLEIRMKKCGSNEFDIVFNREEMANYLCVNRSALSHELSLMRSEGLLDFHKNHFIILEDRTCNRF